MKQWLKAAKILIIAGLLFPLMLMYATVLYFTQLNDILLEIWYSNDNNN